MHTVIPGFDILKAVTDSNIESDAADDRRKAFDAAIELQSRPEAEFQIVIDGHIFDRIATRLNADQITIFREAFRIDNSSANLPTLNHTEGIKFLANLEKRTRKVIILTDSTTDLSVIAGERVVIVCANDFINCTQAASDAYEKKIISHFPDAIAAEFFLNRSP